jgi:diguanylate cyclase (GGDEF)-like protein/PAS domain S-box-containing protein
VFAIYFCIQDDHDLRLVGLAGLICVAAAMAVVTLLRQARDAHARHRGRWLAAAGVTSGASIWATHFIAMLGYDPGVVAGYAVIPTVASLVVAILATTAGFGLSLHSARRATRWLSGTIIGLGIAGMHYLGMQSVLMPADFRWHSVYVLASIVFAIVPVAPALSLTLDRRGRGSGVAAASLIVAAILLLHFTGMTAITLIPDALRNVPVLLLSPIGMAIAVASAAAILLAIGITAAIITRRTSAAINAREREFNVLVQGISDCAIYMLSPEGRVATWNSGAEQLKGYSRREAIGLDFTTFYSTSDRAAGLPEAALDAARRVGKFNIEGWRHRKDGTRFWADVSLEAIHNEWGEFQGFAKITRDMTRMKEDREQLEQLTTNLDAALSNMHQGLMLFGPDERLMLVNDRVIAMFGMERDGFRVGNSLEDLVRVGLRHRDGDPGTDALVAETMARHRACIARPEGGAILSNFSDGRILSCAHRPMPNGGWVTTVDDITERRRTEARIEHMALHDDLTGLPNRASFARSLDIAIADARQSGTRIAVVGIDLDRFKDVNDLHGHAIGDEVLRRLATRLAATVADGEIVSRLGGDEFAAFKAYSDQTELAQFVARLEHALIGLIEIDEISIHPGGSLGIALYPDDGETREQVVNNSDLAMYRAKAAVGRRVCFYEPGMDEALRARRLLAGDLREAITRSELSLAYQVQKSVSNETVLGYEALLRWNHPRDGWISPTDFIPIAEECGEIIRLGEWVLRTACDEAASWPEPWRVAVNLSPVQLMHPDIVQVVTSALLEAGLSPKRLELEITETAIVSDKVRALHVLRQIKALGVSIAIDDFGTGYSSLDTLNSFPFDKIKIDKSFLIGSERNPQSRAIIRAVLALGRSLGMPVLAEGLESEAQLRLLRREGCDQAQGFLWGRPDAAPRATGGKLDHAA